MKIAVVGDAMLDILRVGSSTRVSPECNTCLVVNEHHVEESLGGAANVAKWISLGTSRDVTLYCHHGIPDEGEWDGSRRARGFEVLCKAGCFELAPDLCRPFPCSITTKERIGVRTANGGINYIARIDNDIQGELDRNERETLVQALRHDRPDIIVIADYQKAMFVGSEGQDLIAAFLGRADDIFYPTDNWLPPIIVNSKRPKAWANCEVDFLIYNRDEGEASWPGSTPTWRLSEACARHQITTLGAEGVLVANRIPGDTFGAPAYLDKVQDVTGAGDAFLAGLVAGLALRLNPKDLKNHDLISIIHDGQQWAAECCMQTGTGSPQTKV